MLQSGASFPYTSNKSSPGKTASKDKVVLVKVLFNMTELATLSISLLLPYVINLLIYSLIIC